MKSIKRRLIAFMILFQMLVVNIYGDNVYADNNYSKEIEKIDKYLNDCMEKLDVPGMSIVVVKENEILFSKGYGVESLETNKPMTKDSSSAIGSFTKSFTSIAMLQLEEQGKISLDDPVIKYIPWFKTLDEEKSKKITIKMLLSNTSGIPGNAGFDKIIMINEISDKGREEFIRSLSSYSLNEEPGESYEYCNAGFITAGYIIEKVTGMKYEDYIEENILKSLEMNRSTTNYNNFDKLNVLYGHTAGINSAIPANKKINIVGTPAGSELRCSASDLGNYLIMLMNDGVYKNKRIISKKYIDKLFEPVISFKLPSEWGDKEEWDRSYALGFMRGNIDGVDIITHGGNAKTMSSTNLIDKKNKIGVQLLFNVDSINKEKYQMNQMFIAQNIIRILKGKNIMNEINEHKKIKSDFILQDESKENYIGTYTNPLGSVKMTIEENEEGLFLEINDLYGIWQYAIEFISPSKVKLDSIAGSTNSEFLMTSDGKVTGMSMLSYGYMIKLPKDIYKGYTKHVSSNEKISFLLNKEFKVEWEKENFIITDKDNMVNVKGEKGIDIEKPSEFKNRGKVLFESEGYKENISSYTCTEKVLILEEDGERKQIILVSIQGKMNYAITAEVPYGIATTVIRDIILQVIDTLE